MKVHSTNYQNTFIEVAEDCPVNSGQQPPQKGDKKSVANYQYDLLKENPYKFTSDDIFFTVFANRNEIDKNELSSEREKFFSKGQPCFRASPLTKRYGWGVHSDENGKVAVYGVETEEYQRFVDDESFKKVKAMKLKR
ncbi:DUF6157 family protein [Tunicatimonas pelagia]|uniref:DUF6157 family protein n=1 Tax=Tunicatimonas pelagia TaxID=931531 RepID=UPI00266545E6|nr:DUF6157 family protein [Tunicatimonas pelagia]WKN45185.1 DUF6157 family protein [Tunicatimonas pelagia]